MEGNRSGGRRSSWRYRGEMIRSDSRSSRSGTVVSTAYTSSASRNSDLPMVRMYFDSLDIHEEEEHAGGNNVEDYDDGDSKTGWEEEAKERMNRIRSLVQQFSKVHDTSVVERCLMELGVGWVLGLVDAASTWKKLELPALSWIRALDEIVRTVCFMRPLFPDRGSTGLPCICHEEGEHVGETCIPDRYHLVLFIQETMLKMLNFVDAIVSRDTFMTEGFRLDRVMPASYNKFIALLVVHDALSKASSEILWAFDSSSSVEVQRIANEMVILLSANKSKAGEAIRSTMEKIRTTSMEGGNEPSTSLNQQQSSDIHKITRSVMAYIRLLWTNYKSVDAAIHVQYVTDIENVRPLDSMIIEMLSCLEEKLANISEPFPDQGLRFLFLLNNLYFMLEEVSDLSRYPLQGCLGLYVDLSDKIKGHVERYVEVSWALLLTCLFNPTPIYLGKTYSPLSKFESKFQKLYTTQKQWKVPHPEVRRNLREAITDKIIPGYKEYLEDNKDTTPKFTPQELEEILQELFEGDDE